MSRPAARGASLHRRAPWSRRTGHAGRVKSPVRAGARRAGGIGLHAGGCRDTGDSRLAALAPAGAAGEGAADLEVQMDVRPPFPGVERRALHVPGPLEAQRLREQSRPLHLRSLPPGPHGRRPGGARGAARAGETPLGFRERPPPDALRPIFPEPHDSERPCPPTRRAAVPGRVVRPKAVVRGACTGSPASLGGTSGRTCDISPNPRPRPPPLDRSLPHYPLCMARSHT